MDKFLNELNDKQREAVETLDGPVLVIAGAGSGKTKTLTYRIAYLIKEKNIPQNSILAVTFTNKAANEMKERLRAVIGMDVPFIGTFHSMCVKFLRNDGENIGIRRNFNIYDTGDSLDAIKEAMKRKSINAKDFSPYKVLGLISSCKSELISPEEYHNFARMPIQEATANVYPLYQQILHEAGALDFDDLIVKTVEMFTHKQVLERYQEQFKYVLVDEYQDTNHAQYMLVKMLAKKYRNIYCVGDPDQNIYTFRGATIDNILNFENDYSDAKVILLEQNYRSTKNILKSAHHVISKNTKRKDKEMWTDNREGEKIKRYIASNEKDEAYFIVNRVRQTRDYSKYAVLYRTNAQSRAIEEVFLEDSIPYKLVGGQRFYDRKEVKDLLGFLRLISNVKDNIALKRVINIPPRKIGKKTLDDIDDIAFGSGMSIMEYLFANKKSLSAPLQTFTSLMEYFISLIGMNEITLTHFINIIIEKIGYIPYLEEDEESGKARVENIKELNTVASRYDDQRLQEGLEAFLENVSLVEQESAHLAEEGGSAVTLMSIHSAKGLEFDTVFLIGMEEGLFPHGNSMYSPDDLEEERRLAYVGMTRAKKELYLLNAETRVLYGSVQSNPVSRFVRDIPDNLLKTEQKYSGYNNSFSYGNSYADEVGEGRLFHKGDHVFHPTFQQGVVIEASGDSITVRFEGYGTKKLLLAFAKGMTILDY